MLNQTSKYALQALIYLTHQPDDDYHQTREVARVINVPANYLGKTLQKMARCKIVDSQKGLRGGFRIARLPEQIRLFDVFQAIEAIPKDLSNLNTAVPAEAASDSKDELKRLYERLAGINRIYAKFLKETTLADLLEPGDSALPAALAKAEAAATSKPAPLGQDRESFVARIARPVAVNN